MKPQPENPIAEPKDSPLFELFDLSVTLGPGLVPWISAVSRLGHVHGIPRRDPAIPPLDQLLDSVYDFVDAVRFAERDPLSSLTQALGQLVFGEPAVLELFQATRGAASDRGREVLVRVLASPHLAVLPWELLPDPAQRDAEREGRFLTLAPDASVVRLARGRTYPIRNDRLEPPLNLLVVVSSPTSRNPADDSLAFDIYEEKRNLLAELQPLVDEGLLRVDVEDQPTLENLRRRIGAQRRGYHLFHYLGHAEPDRLILEDEQGRRDDQSGTRFTEILRLCPDLRLAVFAGCETARAPGDPLAVDAAAAQGWRHILSLADRCVQESCPVVVGMQAVLPFRTERLFTRFFYQGLASGYSVTGAMRLARGATRGDRHVGRDLLDWSVPVLFVGGSDPAPLLDRSAKGVLPELPERYVLRLGLRQRETRFFARDVALRQAVDVLSGISPERVLALTGPSGVGKTMLIDRALEEITGSVSILYVRLEQMIPDLEEQLDGKRRGQQTFRDRSIPDFKAEAPLGKLCQLVAELMNRANGHHSIPQPGWTPQEWWPRLIEDLTSRRFVLVIDNLDVLVELEEAVTDRLIEFWFASRLDALTANGKIDAQRLSNLVDGMLGHLRQSSGLTQPPGADENPLITGLAELGEWVGSPRLKRTAVARINLFARRLKELQRNRASIRDLAGRLRKDPRVLPDTANPVAISPADAVTALRGDVERLASTRQILDHALRVIADRRSGVRLAVAASRLPDEFLDLSSERRFVMRLGRLTWSETWRWIRRNLPGLLRYGEEYLGRLWPRLGSELERWEELERRVLLVWPAEPNMQELVDMIAPRRPSAGGLGKRIFDARPRGERPLRVAVAGPHIASDEAFAHAVTRLAAEHGVGGRVVSSQEEESGSLARIEGTSVFGHADTVTDEEMIKWLVTVSESQPDIILLDYGYMVRLPLVKGTRDHPMLQRLYDQSLLIAAGGNLEEPGKPRRHMLVTAPGVYDEVLAVGSLGSDGQLQPYAEWTPQIRKPDLFMVDQLVGTPLEEALSPEAIPRMSIAAYGPGTHGSSFAALNAAAAAILVWSTVPDYGPDEVRNLLRLAAKPVKRKSKPAPMALSVADAVAAARSRLIMDTLTEGPCSVQALAAITGLELRFVSENLEHLAAAGKVRQLPRGRLERYEAIPAG